MSVDIVVDSRSNVNPLKVKMRLPTASGGQPEKFKAYVVYR